MNKENEMKKLMSVAAVAAGMVAFGDAIESANIVGYTTYQTDELRQPSFGACFIPTSGAATYKLGDLKPTDISVDDDYLQLINPITLGADATYVYMSKEMADAVAEEEGELPGAYDELIGWWDFASGVGEDGASADNVNINVGQAFLGLFGSGNDIGFVSNGEAPTVSTSISTDGEKQPFFASYIPKTIKLGQIVPENISVDDDYVQVINPTTLDADATYVYMSKEMADAVAEEEGELPGAYDELIGWWDFASGVGEEGASAMNVLVEPGAAFLGLFGSGSDITFNFPSSTAVVPTFE